MIMTKLSVCFATLTNEYVNHGTNTPQENRHPPFHYTSELEAISYCDTTLEPSTPSGR